MSGGISPNLSVTRDPAFEARLLFDTYIFSGAKTEKQLLLLNSLLTDSKGNLKPFQTFLKDVLNANDTYNKNYLKAEYQHAVASADMASRWHKIEKTGDLFDLKYTAVKDEKTRELHKELDGTVLPPSNTFWNYYFPPNGWGCRCGANRIVKGTEPESSSKKAIKTGEKITAGKASIFRFNPGKQRVIFPEKHPYYDKSREKGEAYRFSETIYRRGLNKKVWNWAKENLVGKKNIHKEGLPGAITFTNISKKSINQPHKHITQKNIAIFEIEDRIRKGKLRKETRPDIKNNEMVKQYHYIETMISGETSLINIREMKTGELIFYSITEDYK